MRMVLATAIFAVVFSELRRRGYIGPLDPGLCVAGGFVCLLGIVSMGMRRN
jgi:hypothetical protein